MAAEGIGQIRYALIGVAIGVAGLLVGGYEIARNVFHVGGNGGPPACRVLTPAIAESVLGNSARLATERKLNSQESLCRYTGSAGRFISVEVGSWDYVGIAAPTSGKSNEGIGSGTYLKNTGVGSDGSIAQGSTLGRVAHKGDLGVYVSAGHYGQFFGESAVRELALEDRLEQRLLSELLPRV